MRAGELGNLCGGKYCSKKEAKIGVFKKLKNKALQISAENDKLLS